MDLQAINAAELITILERLSYWCFDFDECKDFPPITDIRSELLSRLSRGEREHEELERLRAQRGYPVSDCEL
jgi:hypothetical protein